MGIVRDRLMQVLAALWVALQATGVTVALATGDGGAWNALLAANIITVALVAVTRGLRLCLADWFAGYAARAAQEAPPPGLSPAHVKRIRQSNGHSRITPL